MEPEIDPEKVLDVLARRLQPFGLKVFGGFRPAPGDTVLLADGAPARAVIMIGNRGGAMLAPFAASPEFKHARNPLETWIRRVVGAIAADFGVHAVYPSDGPPYHPFQRWAMRTGEAFPSPIGLLIRVEEGLWHAYRSALLFSADIGLPERAPAQSPCETCAEKPCLTTCPVGAFGPGGYDVDACAAHLRCDDGRDCIEQGCRARRACPVGRDWVYPPDLARFHQSAFLAAR